jgi:hypothetical protein
MLFLNAIFKLVIKYVGFLKVYKSLKSAIQCLYYLQFIYLKKLNGVYVEAVIVWVVVGVVIFLVLREFFAWYWKINKIVKLLEDINENTAKIARRSEPSITVEEKDKTVNPALNGLTSR